MPRALHCGGRYRRSRGDGDRASERVLQRPDSQPRWKGGGVGEAVRSRAYAQCRESGAFGSSRVEVRPHRAVLLQCRLIARLGQRCRDAHLVEHELRQRRQAPPMRYEPGVPGADCARCAPPSLAQYRCVQCMVEEPGMRKIALEGSCTHRRQRCLQRVAQEAG